MIWQKVQQATIDLGQELVMLVVEELCGVCLTRFGHAL